MISFNDIEADMLIEPTTAYVGTYVVPSQQCPIDAPMLVRKTGGYAGTLGIAIVDGKPRTMFINSGGWDTRKLPLYRQCSAAELEAFNAKLDSLGCGIEGIVDRGNGYEIGSDPEIFVLDHTGTVLPAFKFLKSKDESTPESGLYNYGTPYWDGFQAEFNVGHTTCHASLMDRIQAQLQATLAAARLVDKKARLTYESVVTVPEQVLRDSSDKHVGLGCAPSLNAYEGVERLQVDDPRSLPLRFAGCHMHYGIANKLYAKGRAAKVVQAMDRIAGPILTCMLEGLEDTRRRTFYGKAGEYRLPAHGLEYRVPSSSILCHPVVAHIAFDMCRFAMQFELLGKTKLWKLPVGEADEAALTQLILNEYDVATARRVLKLNEAIVDSMIRVVYSVKADTVDHYQELTPKKFAKIKSIIYDGARHQLPVDDLEANWMLGKPADTSKSSWAMHSNAKNASVVQLEA